MNPLIQGLFSKFREAEELDKLSDSDAFELFAASIMLPDDLLSQAAKTDFLLDPGTTGIDVAVLEINGQIAWDESDVHEICATSSKLEVTVHFLQAKQSTAVSSVEVLNFGDTARRCLNNDHVQDYPKIAAIASAFRKIFDDYATSLKEPPSVNLHFVTTAPRASVADSNVVMRVETVTNQICNLGFIGRVQVSVSGADDLHDGWVRKNHANEVEIQLEKQVNLPKMQGVDQGILGVVSVAELLKLVESSDGSLDERVFYDNVRGFKGLENRVNGKIMDTLCSPERNLLPVLNNGVTVVASSYSPKPGDAIAISGFQVVNGCQTSHCLHFSKDTLGDAVMDVYVPIRLVVTRDEDIATKIIQATNSQTEVQENDLVALTKFQRKLEDFYKVDSSEVNLTYERRSGQFYDKDVTKARVVTIGDQMRSVSAVLLDSPHVAARYPKQLYNEVGTSIFRDDHKLIPYVASAFAAYRIENAFRTGLDPAYKRARYHILMAYKYKVLGEPSAPLNSNKCEMQSLTLIEALKRPDQIEVFREAAEKISSLAGGSLPSSDRLKRQQFTVDLIAHLRDVAEK
ncbi:AIPR family protein [Amycolatopsis sp. NPDC004169]|uniref:AIPR family protein n=1 Tax=Amycolatopsis sp. NPDC004169 TaxID=3154453 RepID=UPI0033A57EA6